MRPLPAMIAALAMLGAAGCDRLPGKPDAAERYERPTDVMDFETLYGMNCSGCHGAEGRLGPSRPLNDPLYLAYVGQERMRQIVAHGVAGTPMPGFLVTIGGTLTEKQIAALVREIFSHWADESSLRGVSVPAYEPGQDSTENAAAADSSTDSPVADGGQAFATFCASCHGADGDGGDKAGSVVNPNYLALVSDQNLRTSVVAGRTDLGMPDFRKVGDRPMKPEEIDGVVAWMTAQRKSFPEARVFDAPGNRRN